MTAKHGSSPIITDTSVGLLEETTYTYHTSLMISALHITIVLPPFLLSSVQDL